MKIHIKILAIVALIALLSSCEKEFLDTSPTDGVTSDGIFETTQGGYLALNGVYRFLYDFNRAEGGDGHDNYGVKSTHLSLDLLGNDMVLHSQGYGWYVANYNYTEHRNELAVIPLMTWHLHYNIVNNANQILANIDDADGPTAEKNSVKGQALALRAFGLFQNVQLYAQPYAVDPSAPGIPIYTEPTLEGGPRSSVDEVYAQITQDLDEAITLFADAAPQRHISHLNLASAHGLRARVALVMEDWTAAIEHATAAIAAAEGDGKSLYTPADYTADGFNSVSGSEWLWGTEVNEEQATIFASFYSHMDARFLTYAQLGMQKKITKELYDQFPDSDVRKSLFIAPGEGSDELVDYNQMKFLVPEVGSWAADYLFMRLSEMYLIKAEAEARSGSDDAQQTLFELVSERDPDYELSTNTGQALIDEIMLHRRLELWGEGHGLTDIRRLVLPLERPSGQGNHSASLARVLTLEATSNEFLFKIPLDEIDANDALTNQDQNP